MIIYHSSGKWAFPPLLWSFPPTTAFTRFPAPDCWAGATSPTLSSWLVYLQFMWEVGLPHSPVEFSSHCHFYNFPATGFWACAAAPAFSGRLVYLQFREEFPLPPVQHSGRPTLFATCLFCYCSLFSFSFFSAWGSVFPGGYADLSQVCLWEYHMPVSSPCGLHLPKQSGRWCLAAWELSWFLRLM
jgi:hypothetical protein